ncbi:unnamed protein product [Oreochromis niloticus]|nr:unnamed protein product [Mustela putorius furo]
MEMPENMVTFSERMRLVVCRVVFFFFALLVMSFDMDDFAQQPSIEKLERCTKADLLLVANLFNVDVPLNSKKAEIKQCLVDKLVDRGVFGRMKTLPGGSGSLETAVGAKAAGAIPKPSKGRMMSGAEAPVAVQYRVVIMMRVSICCCLFAFFLGCNVTADIKHTIIRDKDSVTLDCPVSVEGNVTWSRKNSGRIVDILTADGNTERRHIDDTRFKSSADKSLIILRPAASDTGTYLCNNKPAVLLTVISPANATSAPPTNSDHQLLLGLIYGTAASFICIIIIIIIVASVFSPARRGSNKQGSERKEHVYHYIIDDVRFKAENDVGQEAAPGC